MINVAKIRKCTTALFSLFTSRTKAHKKNCFALALNPSSSEIARQPTDRAVDHFQETKIYDMTKTGFRLPSNVFSKGSSSKREWLLLLLGV